MIVTMAKTPKTPKKKAKKKAPKPIPPERARFAERLRAAREQQYSSGKDFADALGIQEARYRKWERGESEPSIPMLIQIQRKLHISLDLLISGLMPRFGPPDDFPAADQQRLPTNGKARSA